MKPIEAAEKLQGSIDGHEIRIEIFEMAIEALLQMEERNAPCEWCRNAIDIRLSKWRTNAQYDIKISFDNEAQNAKYCPMCGRKLTEVQDGPT